MVLLIWKTYKTWIHWKEVYNQPTPNVVWSTVSLLCRNLRRQHNLMHYVTTPTPIVFQCCVSPHSNVIMIHVIMGWCVWTSPDSQNLWVEKKKHPRMFSYCSTDELLMSSWHIWRCEQKMTWRATTRPFNVALTNWTRIRLFSGCPERVLRVARLEGCSVFI